MSRKKMKYQDPAMQPPKALMQLVDAFTDTYKPVEREEYADEVFTVRRIREYFRPVLRALACGRRNLLR